MRFILIASALAWASIIAVGTEVLAQEVPTTSVGYGDLNLSSEEGVRTLNRRVEKAARTICNVNSDTRDLGQQAQSSRCYKAALDSAKPQVEAAVNGSASTIKLVVR
jgi:UrcA family protein